MSMSHKRKARSHKNRRIRSHKNRKDRTHNGTVAGQVECGVGTGTQMRQTLINVLNMSEPIPPGYYKYDTSIAEKICKSCTIRKPTRCTTNDGQRIYLETTTDRDGMIMRQILTNEHGGVLDKSRVSQDIQYIQDIEDSYESLLQWLPVFCGTEYR